MNKEENTNLFLAIALSILVIVGWNYFYAGPQLEKQRQEKQAQQTTQPTTPQPSTPGITTPGTAIPGTTIPGTPVPGTTTPAPAIPGTPAAGLTRDSALAQSPRITIETPRLKGSIALRGARIDDLLLSNYRDTIDPKSPNIELFSPSQSPKPYYAEFGWVAGQGTSAAMPTAQTEWTASSQKLTPEAPLTLSWNNGQGLTFKRQIAVDANYLFT
eukprot:gene58820-78479_t